jgi:hypothetical protein
VAVHHRVWPDYPDTVEDWAHEDSHRDPNCRVAQWLAEVGGAVVGVAGFDPVPFEATAARPLAEGIVLRTWPELADVPERERHMWLLAQELVHDVPSPEPRNPVDFDYYVRERLGHPDFLAEGLFVALDGAEWVGFTQLWCSQASPKLYTGLTGVKRNHRRRHIALALKLCAIASARAIGVPVIKAWNEQNNRGVLAINERLGFVKQPAWTIFVKALGGATAVRMERG